ncbi:MAG: hypothetical protein IJT15_00170 [Rickettsiales bacterium]|nr:hypothetical protein [Rickettsiales bacterium]
MNRSIQNKDIFALTKAELRKVPTFDELRAEYKNSQVPQHHIFEEDGWKYKFDQTGYNTTTGVGMRKCNVRYPILNKTKDAIIIEKGQFVNGKLNGDNCIKAIKDLYGDTKIYMGKFVNGKPIGRCIFTYKTSNSDFTEITVGNISENMKFIGPVQRFWINSDTKITGNTIKKPQTFHRDNEQLWILHSEDKKTETLQVEHFGYGHQNSINILNAKKNRTSIQMLKKIPLAKNTKHLKILLDNSKQNIVSTKTIAEQIKNKVNKQSLSSIYLSYAGNKNGYDDVVESMKSLVTNNVSKYCFFSKIKDEYQTKLVPSFKYGIKRMVIGQDNEPIELADMTRTPNKYKEYYCVYKDPNGDIQVLLVPHDFVRNRVKLIETGKINEALTTLQKGKSYTFSSNGLNYKLQPYDLEKDVKYGEMKLYEAKYKNHQNGPANIKQTDYYDAGIISGTPKSI